MLWNGIKPVISFASVLMAVLSAASAIQRLYDVGLNGVYLDFIDFYRDLLWPVYRLIERLPFPVPSAVGDVSILYLAVFSVNYRLALPRTMLISLMSAEEAAVERIIEARSDEEPPVLIVRGSGSGNVHYNWVSSLEERQEHYDALNFWRGCFVLSSISRAPVEGLYFIFGVRSHLERLYMQRENAIGWSAKLEYPIAGDIRRSWLIGLLNAALVPVGLALFFGLNAYFGGLS